MTLKLTLIMDFGELPTLDAEILRSEQPVSLTESQFKLEAYLLRPADAGKESARCGRIVESQMPALSNPGLLAFERVTASAASFRLETASASTDIATVQAMASALVCLLDTNLTNNETVSVRSLLLEQGETNIQTECLVVDPKAAINNLQVLDIPYWLNYLLRDVGWRGELRLFRTAAAMDHSQFREGIPVAALHWSLSRSVVTQALMLTVSSDVVDESGNVDDAFASKLRNKLSAQSETTVDRPHEDPAVLSLLRESPFVPANPAPLVDGTGVLTAGRHSSKLIPIAEGSGKDLYCWCFRSPSQRTPLAAGFTVVLWHWSTDPAELDDAVKYKGWRLVGQVAPDDLAAVPAQGAITTVLEIDSNGRVWTRVENDQREPMAILVGRKNDSSRPGVNSLEVSNISCPNWLNGENDAVQGSDAIDWFAERVVSDRLVVNRKRLQERLRGRHDDVWGGEDIATDCRVYLANDMTYLSMIPTDASELRAFVENCLR